MPDHPYACDAVGVLHVIMYSFMSIPSYHYKEAQALQQSFEHYTVHLYIGVDVITSYTLARHPANFQRGLFCCITKANGTLL